MFVFVERVKYFIDYYDIDWDMTLQESPQQLVRNWFSCRQVHADYQPQLGNDPVNAVISCETQSVISHKVKTWTPF